MSGLPLTRRRFSLLAASLLAPMPAASFAAADERETDPQVLRRLERWQDWKFGLLMHWGPYSQRGIVESWSICSEDVEWCKRPDGIAYADYVREYERLPETFDPVKFDPDAWARAAHAAGMRYMVFTTKHHDGFCMFDTRQTEYRITAPQVPFHANPRANIANEVFAAFRQQGFGIGAYFSKPDWHSDDYWSPRWATPNRHTNYDTRKHPELWRRFVAYTHAQIGELTSGYGPLDILWLDGGWVRNRDTMDDADGGTAGVPWPQDIDMPGLVRIARGNQPGLIVVDRAVGGRHENYRTPEQHIPETGLDYPWETCMTMGDSWSYVPDDNYKSVRDLVHALVDVVSKGGNFLLNVGPAPDGTLPPVALQRMAGIGAWMQANGRAIHGSRKLAPYRDRKLRFTRGHDGTAYAIYLADADEAVLPATLRVAGLAAPPRTRVRVLGSNVELAWQHDGEALVVHIPEHVRERLQGAPAWTLAIPGAVAAG